MLLHSGVSFSIFGLTINLYGVMIAIGIIAGVIVAICLAKKRGLKTDDIITLALYVLPIAILGARAYYVIFNEKIYSFIEFFEIWNGGLAVLGSIIGGAIGATIYCLIHKKNFLHIADIAVPAVILGQAIGRIGCYFGGCCYGIEVTSPSFQWFPISTQINGVWHYSTFFYESLWCILGFVALLILFKHLKKPGQIMSCYFIIYGVGRCIIETFRGDSLYLFGTGIKVSQLLSGLLVLLGIIMLIIIHTIHKKRNSSKTDETKSNT